MAENNDNTEERELLKISDEELNKILEEHEKWVASKGKEGKRADLRMADLEKADLRKANLQKADLYRANLSEANLWKANLWKANLYRANLQKAVLSSAILQEAELIEANLQKAKLHAALLRKANLYFANLQKANLSFANLQKAHLSIADFERANVTGVKYNRKGRYRGIRVATCYGSPRFRRFAQDQDFIEELRDSGRRGKVIYYLWLIFADCGRTPWYWILWSIFFAVGFGYLYYFMGEGAFEAKKLAWSRSTTIYYSVVTFTTLGFGDIIPWECQPKIDPLR